MNTLNQRLASEALGTSLLLATVVGSGVMAETLSNGNVGLALLANTIATGAALVALITTFGPISGAHLNPVVTAVLTLQKAFPRREAPYYVAAQFVGALVGVVVAHVMFELPLISLSTHVRSGASQLVSEFVATLGLICVVLGAGRNNPAAVPVAVGGYITAAYWFTASTSFANPAVTVARSLSDTFAGIRPLDAPGFIVAQLVGAAAGASIFAWFGLAVPTQGDQRNETK